MKIKLGQTGKDGAPQKPIQTSVVVPTNTPKPAPCGVHPEFKHRAAKVVSGLYIGTGIVGTIIATIATVAAREGCSTFSHSGFVFAIIAGSLGIAAAVKKRRGLIIAFLVFAIITMILSAIAPVKETYRRHQMERRRHHDHRHEDPKHHGGKGPEHHRGRDSSEEHDDDELERGTHKDGHRRGRKFKSREEIEKMKAEWKLSGMNWEDWHKKKHAEWDRKRGMKKEDYDDKKHEAGRMHKPEEYKSRHGMKSLRVAKIVLGVIHILHFIISIISIVLCCKVVGCCRKRRPKTTGQQYQVPVPVAVNVDTTSSIPDELSPKILAEQMYVTKQAPPTCHQEELVSHDRPPAYNQDKEKMTDVNC